jgi:hypothetical protein
MGSFTRFIALFFNAEFGWPLCHEATTSNAKFPAAKRGCNPGSEAVGARWFQGQTSWQISHP